MAQAATLPHDQPRKRVHFASLSISYTALAYDRTAVESDVFSCDVCGIRIPAGLKGFEPCGTCAVCPDGFDACGACCGTAAVMALCQTYSPHSTKQPTVQVSCHPHALRVVDRKAEVDWANGSARGANKKKTSPKKKTKTPIKTTPVKKSGTKRSPRSRSKSPRSNRKQKV